MKEEELNEEGVLRRPPLKPLDEIWLKKYEMLEMTFDMTPTQKIPLLSLLNISLHYVPKNESRKAFVSSLKLKKEKLNLKEATSVMSSKVEQIWMKEVEKLWKKR